MCDPLVSIVVTTKNEQRHIENCLLSIALQSYPAIEIIVVDNASDDATPAIARRFTPLVFNKGPERSAQRNYGMIEKATGAFVMYIDADMILSPDLVRACVERMARDDAVALHVPEQVLGTSFWGRVRNFERSFYDGTAIDGARFFRRSAFVKVGGFDEALFRKGSGEDWDIDKLVKTIGRIALLSRRCTPSGQPWPMAELVASLGIRHQLEYCGIYHNEAAFSIGPYLKKKLYYSQGFDGYIAKWGKDDPDIRKQFGFGYRFFGVFLENRKWRKLIARPDLAFGMYLLRFLVGMAFISRRLWSS